MSNWNQIFVLIFLGSLIVLPTNDCHGRNRNRGRDQLQRLIDYRDKRLYEGLPVSGLNGEIENLRALLEERDPVAQAYKRDERYSQTERNFSNTYSDGAGNTISGNTSEFIVNEGDKLKPSLKWINKNYDYNPKSEQFFKIGDNPDIIVTEADVHESCQAEGFFAGDCAKVIHYRLNNRKLHYTQLEQAKESLNELKENAGSFGNRQKLLADCKAIKDMAGYSREQDELFKGAAIELNNKLKVLQDVVVKNSSNKDPLHCKSQRNDVVKALKKYEIIEDGISKRCDLLDLDQRITRDSNVMTLKSSVVLEPIKQSLLFQAGIDSLDKNLPFNTLGLINNTVQFSFKSEEKVAVPSSDFIGRLTEMSQSHRFPANCGKVVPVQDDNSIIVRKIVLKGMTLPGRPKKSAAKIVSLKDITINKIKNRRVTDCAATASNDDPDETEAVSEYYYNGVRYKTVFVLDPEGTKVTEIYSQNSIPMKVQTLANIGNSKKSIVEVPGNVAHLVMGSPVSSSTKLPVKSGGFSCGDSLIKGIDWKSDSALRDWAPTGWYDPDKSGEDKRENSLLDGLL
jgi:hypothetical protein